MIAQLTAESRIEWASLYLRSGLPTVLMVLLMLVAVAYTIWMYRKESNVSPLLRAGMATLRGVVLCLLIVLLFRPVVTRSYTTEQKQQVLVLVDDSQSMAIQDSRKDRENLLDAAVATDHMLDESMAGARIPFVRPRAQVLLDRARQAMLRARRELNLERVNEARAAQQRAEEAMQDARDALRGDGPGEVPPQLVSELDALLERQKELGRQILTGQGSRAEREGSAQSQAALAQGVEQLLVALRDPGTPIDNDRQAELARLSRRDIARALLKHGQFNLFERLSDDVNVRYYSFAEDVASVTPEDWPGDRAEQGREAGSTRIGTAIRQVLSKAGEQPVAGIVLLTDGANTGGEDPLRVASDLQNRGVPLFPVGIGLAEPDDVALRSLVMQDLVFAGDRVPIRVHIHSHGYENRTANLSVSMDGVEVASEPVVFTGRPQIAEISFEVDEITGRRELEVAISAMPNEALLENNTIMRTVEVADEKLRVLCIEGSPRWEYRYLRAVLKRDPRIEAMFLTTEGDRELARASREHVARFPEEADEAFSYDLVILGDVRPDTFTPAQLDRLHELIRDRGGAMIVLAGHKHNPAEYVNTPVGQMLPVEPVQGEWELVDDNTYPVLTPEGERSTMMQLVEGEGRNRALWAKVKPLVRAPVLEGARRGAHVLAELSTVGTGTKPTPIVAWHRYGNGKVLFIGTDRLFRLREGVGDKYHARFWGQAVQFLALSRLRGDDERISFEVSGAGAAGEPVSDYASALNELWEPLSAPRLMARVRAADDEAEQGELVPLNPVPGIEGMFHGFFVPPTTGVYEVTAAQAEEGEANVVSFEIAASSEEQTRVAMDRDLLSRMGGLSGGRYVNIRELPVLLNDLTAPAQRIEEQREHEIFDHWLWLLPLVGLLAAEWTWRRRKDLA